MIMYHYLPIIKYLNLIIFCCGLQTMSAAQPYATWSKTTLKLNNGVVERTIQLPAMKSSFITTSYKPIRGVFKYFTAASTDFQFEAGNKIYAGSGEWLPA